MVLIGGFALGGPVAATPFITINFQGELTKPIDPDRNYGFSPGAFSGAMVMHHEGILNENVSEWNDYYTFSRDHVDISINGIRLDPAYPYYNRVRYSYCKTDGFTNIQAITVGQENFREGTVNFESFSFNDYLHQIKFHDVTQSLSEPKTGIIATRYCYEGTIESFAASRSCAYTPRTLVPEPSALILALISFGGLLGTRKRFKFIK